ncbi:MAG TPA: GAF domain-containing protein [Candidatus Kapabacteria bacterium]|nr:GAF domain-containing protein [Candidatus Kapabacteria bacterium]
MAKSNFNIKNFFNAGDILAVVVIIAGVSIAVFVEDIAVKMIGVSIGLLGTIALFMFISRRLSDIVDTNAIKKKPTTKQYEVTTVQDSNATRTTFENFDIKFGDNDLIPFTPISIQENPIQTPQNVNEEILQDTNTDQDSFTIKGKSKTDIINSTTNEVINEIPKPDIPLVDKQYQFGDSISSVKIIGKIKRKAVDSEINNEQIKFDSPSGVSGAINKSDRVTTINKQIDKQVTKESQDINTNIVNDPAQVAIASSNTELTSTEANKNKNTFPTHFFFESDILIGDEPKQEFEYFVSRILLIIKSVTDSCSVLLVLVDNNVENFSIEAFTTDKELNIESKKKIPISNDIISQIIKNSKPEILSEINPSAVKDLIPYYAEEVEIKSFIGIPIIWNDIVIGVMCADSINLDCFDSATVSFMGQFSKLISGLVKSYTHKIDLIEAAKTLDTINKFQNMVLSENLTKESLYSSIVSEVKRMYGAYTVGIATYNYDTESWAINIYDNGIEQFFDMEIDFNGSLLGKCIVDGETIYLSGIEIVNIKRVNNKETKFLSGEFLATPLRTHNGVYGAIFIESSPKERLSDFNISILQVLSNHIAVSLERFNLINLYRTSCIVDRSSGLYNYTAFYKRLNEEIDRFETSENSNLALCMFRIDKYASLDPNLYADRLDMAVSNAIELSKNYAKSYEIIGRIDSETFAIIFINHKNSDLKLIAERFRNEVANSIIEFDNTKFSVTISIGLASYQKRLGINALVSNSITALTRSMQYTNHVQVYN